LFGANFIDVIAVAAVTLSTMFVQISKTKIKRWNRALAVGHLLLYNSCLLSIQKTLVSSAYWPN